MAGFHLEIVTPERVRFDDTVDCLVAPGVEGAMGLLPGHAPILALTEPGIAHVRAAGKDLVLAVGPGFVTMQANKAVYLAEFAEKSDEINEAAVRSALADLQKRLAGSLSQAERESLSHERKVCQVRLDVASRKG